MGSKPAEDGVRIFSPEDQGRWMGYRGMNPQLRLVVTIGRPPARSEASTHGDAKDRLRVMSGSRSVRERA